MIFKSINIFFNFANIGLNSLIVRDFFAIFRINSVLQKIVNFVRILEFS